jgi:hypothetical protein
LRSRFGFVCVNESPHHQQAAQNKKSPSIPDH